MRDVHERYQRLCLGRKSRIDFRSLRFSLTFAVADGPQQALFAWDIVESNRSLSAAFCSTLRLSVEASSSHSPLREVVLS